MDFGQTNRGNEECERCGDFCESPEECAAIVEERRIERLRREAPSGAFRSDLAVCAKCEWPLILHGPECEEME
jgi:hypothetical protein